MINNTLNSIKLISIWTKQWHDRGEAILNIINTKRDHKQKQQTYVPKFQL